MKKIKNMKPGAKKQLLSGVVYVALSVTVVAVTINAITSSFTDKMPDVSTKNEGGAELDNFRIQLPESLLEIEDFNLDSPVSDSPSGIDATVTDGNTASNPETVTDEQALTPKTDEQVIIPEIAEESIGSEVAEESLLTEQISEPDRTRPVSEEPDEKVFEPGFDGFIKPVSGYVSREFSVDVPVYSPTMYDYRTHRGVDIACDVGSPVRASSNGVISEIYNDYMFGTTLVMEHDNGRKTVYSNLSPDLPAGIRVGKMVATGEVIAGVGQTALCESAEVSHLHFELTENGVPLNPEDYFNKKN